MAHKTLIGGTAYEVSGGKTLIDGTVYTIDKGKTLVEGTAYEVGFARDAVVTLKLTSYSSNYGSYAVIDGKTYTKTTLTVPVGTVIKLYLKKTQCGCGANKAYSYTYLNGTRVSTATSYSYKVTGNVSIHDSTSMSGVCDDNDSCYAGAQSTSLYIVEE